MDGSPAYRTEVKSSKWCRMMDFCYLSKEGNGMRLFYKMYIACDLVLYEPTCAIWEDIAPSCALCYFIAILSLIAFVGSYSTQSLCDIHQNLLFFYAFPTK